MRKTFLILSLAVFCAPAFALAAEFSPEEIEAARKDPQAFVLDRGSVRIIRINGERAPEPPPNVPPVPPAPGPLPPSPLPPGGINPDIIVNIGKMIWEIIEANRPVVDVKQSYATAVPDGITHWTQLAGWSPPELTVYELSAKNLRGGNAVQVRFQVMRTAGGSFRGKGKYLTGVTIEPLMISVSSGYKFYLEAAVPAESVANRGSHDDPIAGMIATLKWKIKTAANETQGTRLYYLQGDGLFKDITGFPQSLKEDSQKALRGLQSPIVW
jgi:hypothetical protein